MWPKDSEAEYRDLEDEHYVYRVRNRLRQEVLVPIRKVLELPEVYMSARQWDSLPYDGVSSVAIKNYAKIFKKHDEVRFLQCLEQVKEGKGTIAAGALLPHEIVASAKDWETAEVAELQWQRMVCDLSEKGKLTNCIAVCDVSGWLSGAHFEAGLALAVLVSELSEEPWKGRVITFSSKPELHKIIGETVTEKMEFVKSMEKGLNANFQMVFDRLLEVAIAGNVCKEKMIKRVFVFSQMNFDEASEKKWETDYEAICRKFEEKGYGSCVPEIVFWNLGAPRWMPVSASQNGVALVSGFLKNWVKIFVERDGEMSPESIMEDAISGEEYQKLVVFD